MAETNKPVKKKMTKKRKKLSLKAWLKIILVTVISASVVIIGARVIGGVTLPEIAEEIKIFFISLGRGDGYPTQLTGASAQQIYAENGKILIFSKDKTLFLSSSAKNIASIPTAYGNPAIRYKNGKAVVYDRDSGKYRIQSTSKIISESESEKKILCAAIGKKGNYAVATAASGIKTDFTAFNKKNEEIFSYSFENEKITDIDLSDDGKFAAVSTVLSKNAVVNSKVYVFKFDSSDYVSCLDFERSTVVNVRYDNHHNVTVVSDKGRTYIEDNGTVNETYSFESHNLFKCSSAEKKYSAVALKKYGGDNFGQVIIFNGEKTVCTIDIDKEIKDVECGKKYTTVLTSNSVLVFKNSNGKQIAELSADASVTELVTIKKKVYLMSPSEIQCVKF